MSYALYNLVSFAVMGRAFPGALPYF